MIPLDALSSCSSPPLPSYLLIREFKPEPCMALIVDGLHWDISASEFISFSFFTSIQMYTKKIFDAYLQI